MKKPVVCLRRKENRSVSWLLFGKSRQVAKTDLSLRACEAISIKNLKKLLFLILASTISLISVAQLPHNDADRIKSTNWDIIGELKFDEKSYSEIYPVYSAAMKKYKGKNFELEGYIVPIEKGVQHSRFMLSSLPLNQCYYCGRDGIPAMVLVEMEKSVKYTLKPVKISGILALENRNMLDGYPVLLKKAKQIDR